MAQVKVGVLLSGCGFRDGAEIHESVLTLLALDRAGAEVRCFAPDVAQPEVIDHLRGTPAPGERRNVLVEAARIARGQIADVQQARAKDLDALVMPGGFGAANNLATVGTKGAAGEVNPEVGAAAARDARREEADRGDLHRAARGGEGARGGAPAADRGR